jgi:hypothetical protein
MAMLRSRTVFSDQQLHVTAVESLELRTGRTNRGRFVIGSLTPITIVVNQADRTYKIDLQNGGTETNGRA